MSVVTPEGKVKMFVRKFMQKHYPGHFYYSPMGGAFGIYELLPAFILALVVNIIVCLATPAPSSDVTETFDAVKSEK